MHNHENEQDEREESAANRVAFPLFQWVVSIFLAIIGFFCAAMFMKLMSNGDTLIEVRTTQSHVVEDVREIKSELKAAISTSITRPEHDALALRVTGTEKETAEIKAKLEIMLHEESRDHAK
jgi:hypothetical protein